MKGSWNELPARSRASFQSGIVIGVEIIDAVDYPAIGKKSSRQWKPMKPAAPETKMDSLIAWIRLLLF